MMKRFGVEELEFSLNKNKVCEGIDIRRSISDNVLRLEFSGTNDDGEECTVYQELHPTELLNLAKKLLDKATEYQLNT